MAASLRSMTTFARCSGFNGMCPWKSACGLPLDDGERKCPFCCADALDTARASRGGQDITMALNKLKEVSADALQQGLSRLERFGGEILREEYSQRVERAIRKRSLAAMRRPAAAAADAAEASDLPENDE